MDLGFFRKFFWQGTSTALELTELGDLPNEVLEDIFSYLSSVERQHLRLACKKWEAVVNEIFGVKLVITNANLDLMFSSQWAVEVDFDSMTKKIVDNIAFADNVKMITFRHTLVFHNLIPILESCQNIKELCFHEVVVDSAERSMLMPTTEISLIELKKLEFYSSWSGSESLKTIFSFLSQINFGQLEEIIVPSGHSPGLPINLIFLRLPPEITVNPLIRLVLKNIPTLRLFSFGTANSLSRMKFYPFNLFGSQQLEEVEMSLVQADWDWTQTFQKQRHLKKFEVYAFKAKQWGEIRNAITRNASTLTEVKVKDRTYGQTWDCGVFQPTHLLQNLSLNITWSPKTGLDFLPISLTFLNLSGPISLTELVKILNLVALEKLYFKLLGGHLVNNHIQDADPTERIDLQLFKRFVLQLPRLKILSFHVCSLNSLAWDEIGVWCLRISEFHQINLRKFFCDYGNGQKFKSGICLTLPENIIRNRSVLLEDPFDDPLEYLDQTSVMCSACFSALGL